MPCSTIPVPFADVVGLAAERRALIRRFRRLRTIRHSYDLTKFKKSLGESVDEKEIWLTLLNESQDMLDVPQSLMENKSYAAFFEGLRRANFSTEQETNYFNDMTTQRDINNQIKFAQDKGYAEGEAKGESKGKLDVARAMLADGLSIDKVSQYTGLSKESLEVLLAEVQ